ncbi:MAG: DrmB family protein [Promethearchaeota archaeon]
MTQHLRGSQFIYTYGPGAILETNKGPRIIPLPNIGLFGKTGTDVQLDYRFEISDPRISSLIDEKMDEEVKVFRLPSNAELKKTHDYYVYKTSAFPKWKLCQSKFHKMNVLYKGNYCPICKKESNRDTIRFVKACKNGHLDDVDWATLVHEESSEVCSHNSYFWWSGGGQSLSKVFIRCPKCKSYINFGSKFRQPRNCTGRTPEKEYSGSPKKEENCNEPAYITLRQASNLRIPEIKTILSVSHQATLTDLNNYLQISPVQAIISNLGALPNEEMFRQMISMLHENKRISLKIKDDILKCSWAEIQKAYQNNVNFRASKMKYEDLLQDEFLGLLDASIHGAPPIIQNGHSKVLFEVNPNKVETVNTNSGNSYLVAPIQTLRNISVQLGYRRIIGEQQDESDQPNIKPVSFYNPIDDKMWYPGVESYGEGIFIRLKENDGYHFPLKGITSEIWMRAFSSPESYEKSRYVFRSQVKNDELHPVFVWWHTLSHALIREISLRSGYSSASIRERIYFEDSDQGCRGGIILYSTQTGADGTLGGLIAQVPFFKLIMESALNQLKECSSDPLCTNNIFKPGNHSGASCYACTLVSETSCEHRNLWLDRNLIKENEI